MPNNQMKFGFVRLKLLLFDFLLLQSIKDKSVEKNIKAKSLTLLVLSTLTEMVLL